MPSPPMESTKRRENYSSSSDAETLLESPKASKFTSPLNVNAFPLFDPNDCPVIPPIHPFRTLILCFDGTGDQFDDDNSNIVQFFSMLKRDDSDEQMVYYQAGIGTYTSPSIATPLVARLSKTFDEMVAWNLKSHVMDGYEFLMQNYKANDRICIFGFSRGAYTARALAGMLYKVGLLPACNHQQVPFAYSIYAHEDDGHAEKFKAAFSVDVQIEFVGVWDTVNSVGIVPRTLPFATSNKLIKTFRHAVALDERRAKFKPNHWRYDCDVDHDHHDKKAHFDPADGLKSDSRKALEQKYAKDPNAETDALEVWFAGCHCDVGGGSVLNETPYSLAKIPLRWMIRECFKTNSGIMFESSRLTEVGLNSQSLFPVVKDRPEARPVGENYIQRIPKHHKKYSAPSPLMTEEEHELLDALSPIYDQLSLNRVWAFLEIIPFRPEIDPEDVHASHLSTGRSANLAKGRVISKQRTRGVKVHRSVKIRMEAQYENGKKYKPKASFERALEHNTIQWVD